MPRYKVVATVTGATNDAEVQLNAVDVPMTASGGDQWDGQKNLNLPLSPVPLRVSVVGMVPPWGVKITFTPPRPAPTANPYDQEKLTATPWLDMV
jgi:hypothetical protein